MTIKLQVYFLIVRYVKFLAKSGELRVLSGPAWNELGGRFLILLVLGIFLRTDRFGEVCRAENQQCQ